MKQYFWVLIMGMVLLGGCGAYAQGWTAEETLENHLRKEGIGGVHIVSSRPVAGGVVLVYTAIKPGIRQPALFSQIVWQDGATWYTDQCCYYAGGPLLGIHDHSPPLFEYNFDMEVLKEVVIGRTLSPDITRVEATFPDGTVIHDQVHNGIFVLRGPDKVVGICEIRVYTAQDVVLGVEKPSGHELHCPKP